MEAEQSEVIEQKDTLVRVLLNCVISLTICTNPLEPRVIPAGQVFIIFRNASPIFANEPVVACKKHEKQKNGPVFEILDEKNSEIFQFSGKHWGIRWQIPDDNIKEKVCLPFKFICCSVDASYSNPFTRWQVDLFYEGKLTLYTIIPSVRCLKAVEKQTAQKLKVAKADSESSHAPITPPSVECLSPPEDWDFDGNSSSEPKTKLAKITSQLLQIQTQAKNLIQQVSNLMNEIKE